MRGRNRFVHCTIKLKSEAALILASRKCPRLPSISTEGSEAQTQFAVFSSATKRRLEPNPEHQAQQSKLTNTFFRTQP